MGKVFTWEEVRDRRVPRLSSFTQVIDDIRMTISREGAILGALVCGSVTRGDHTVRSDVDCFVLYDQAQEDKAFACMHRASALAAIQHVPLCFIPCDTQLANTRMHHIGSSFRRHLEKSIEAGGLLKGNPLQALAYSRPEKEELEAYLRVKMYNLQEAYAQSLTFSDERMASYLKKLLEAPMHIARKTLAHNENLGDDSKSYIKGQYRESMPRAMSEHLSRIIWLDDHYSEGLSEFLEYPDEGGYHALLNFIRGHSEDILAFIRSNLAFVAMKT